MAAAFVNYLPCTDIDVSIKWYCEALGLKIDPAKHYPGQFAHMFFDITNKERGKEEVDATYKAIQTTGLEVGLKAEPKDENGGFRAFELKGPNGKVFSRKVRLAVSEAFHFGTGKGFLYCQRVIQQTTYFFTTAERYLVMATLVGYVPCTDVEASTKWYCDALGFKLDPARNNIPGRFAYVYLEGPDALSSRAQLMLRNYPRLERDGVVAEGSKPFPLDIYFDIANKEKGRDVVDEKYKAIQDTGVEVIVSRELRDEQGGFRMFEIKDPNGHRISFYSWF